MRKRSLWVSEVADEPSITSNQARRVSGWELRYQASFKIKRSTNAMFNFLYVRTTSIVMALSDDAYAMQKYHNAFDFLNEPQIQQNCRDASAFLEGKDQVQMTWTTRLYLFIC
ncbi:hypothetical protein BDR05DRAFT_305333 [Suillus weaverae]|nr:hypothetical protein BDR05DRAFT_305333 [Suillus weaverae]